MILFFDLDGTLLVDGKISEECRRALEKAKQSGHFLVLNTGRSPAFVPKQIFEDPLWAGHICGSSYTDLFGEVLSREPLSKKTLKSVFEFAKEQNVQVIFEGESENFYTLPQSAAQKDAAGIFEREELPAIVKVTFWCDPLRVPLDRFSGLRIVRFKSYAEGISVGFDKSSGMKLILEEMGFSKEDTMAFGDSENDIDMLKFAGKGVAMKDAPADFDGFCVYRAKNADGVPEALQQLVF